MEALVRRECHKAESALVPLLDTPGPLRYHVIRGTLDTAGTRNRKQGRSKYGAKREKTAGK